MQVPDKMILLKEPTSELSLSTTTLPVKLFVPILPELDSFTLKLICTLDILHLKILHQVNTEINLPETKLLSNIKSQ